MLRVGTLEQIYYQSSLDFRKYSEGSTNLLNIPNHKINNSFPNPVRNYATIKVIHDFTHIFTKLRGQVDRTDLIIHETIRTKYINEYHLSLADKYVSFYWIRLLHQRENEQIYKEGAAINLTNLSYDYIWPSGFQRMRLKYTI